MPVIPSAMRKAMLKAADDAGAARVLVRVSVLREHATEILPHRIQPGQRAALLRSDPTPSVELWTVADSETANDWEVR